MVSGFHLSGNCSYERQARLGSRVGQRVAHRPNRARGELEQRGFHVEGSDNRPQLIGSKAFGPAPAEQVHVLVVRGGLRVFDPVDSTLDRDAGAEPGRISNLLVPNASRHRVLAIAAAGLVEVEDFLKAAMEARFRIDAGID